MSTEAIDAKLQYAQELKDLGYNRSERKRMVMSWDLSGPKVTKRKPLPGQAAQDSFRSALREFAGMLSAPDLKPYKGRTKVELTGKEKQALSLIRQVMEGEVGTYREALEGEPNYRDLGTLFNISRRQMEDRTLPAVRDAFSGSSYYSGARRAAESGVRQTQQTNELGALIGEKEAAMNRSLQATSALPMFQQAFAVKRMNDIANLERKMKVHYANQGLSVQSFEMDRFALVTAISGALGQMDVGFKQQALDLQAQQLKMQRDAQKDAGRAGLFGAIGSIGGAALGFGLGFGPGGAMFGSSFGGGLGQMLSGSPTGYASGYSTLSSGIQQGAQNYWLSSLMQSQGLPGLYDMGPDPVWVRPLPYYGPSNTRSR